MKKKRPDDTDPKALEAERQRMSEQLQRLLYGRELEQFMENLMDKPMDKWEMPAPTSRAEAQDLCYDAWEEPRLKQRLKLARRALALWPDCADAYLILAENAKSIDEERRILEQAVAAGERALGPDAFKEYAGHFWSVHATRAYMRARLALAVCLWHSGQRESAIDHAYELLRLNPRDNQGVRYLLVAWLLEFGDNARAGRPLERFAGDQTANLEYARLLLQYRNWGDTDKSRRLFRRAFRSNNYVPEYLLGVLAMPDESPEQMAIGGDDEAVTVAEDLGPAWQRTPGALDWLKERWLETMPGSETTRR